MTDNFRIKLTKEEQLAILKIHNKGISLISKYEMMGLANVISKLHREIMNENASLEI